MAKTQSSSPTTAQSLGALLKSAHDIMRKDKGLNGDLDRLPMLTLRSSRREEAQTEKSEIKIWQEPRDLGCYNDQNESQRMICP